jgi:hypothetical protein
MRYLWREALEALCLFCSFKQQQNRVKKNPKIIENSEELSEIHKNALLSQPALALFSISRITCHHGFILLSAII